MLETCLRALQHINDVEFTTVVIDSAPTTSEAKLIAARYGARYELSPLKGVSRARNIGLRTTNADIIAYLDDDMVPRSCWLHSLVAPLASADVTAVTGPMISMEFAESSRSDLRLALEFAPRGPQRFEIDRSCRQWFERTNFGGIGDGNYAIRRSALLKIQGFDERLGRGSIIDSSEEHYVFFKLVDNGSKIVYSPEAIVFHPDQTRDRGLLRKEMADAAAYAAFLAWHHPTRAWRVIKYFCEGVFHTRRWWRASKPSQIISLSSRDRIGSTLEGLSLFFRAIKQPVGSAIRSRVAHSERKEAAYER